MQKKFIKLTQEELLTLQQGHKNHRCYQVRNRCQCLLLSHQGKQVKELAAIFSVIALTIYTWFYRWEEKGLVGLLNEKGIGRKPILLQAESEKIKTQVQANAQQLKVASGVLKAELNKEFSRKTLKRYLKKLMEDGKGGEKA